MRKIVFVIFVFVGLLYDSNCFQWSVAKQRISKEQIKEQNKPSQTIESYITQKLNNFNVQNSATFQQRFFMNGEYFQPKGPIIIVLGERNKISPWRILETLPGLIARKYNGYIFYLEHRYYGGSYPLQNASTTNMQCLSVDQALADIAYFIKYIKSPNTIGDLERSPVVLVGSLYGGSLAVWARQKYPHLVTAAWASSAPLLYKVDFQEFNEHVGWAFRNYGSNDCYVRLKNGFQEMEDMMLNENSSKLSELFNLCQTLATPMDFGLFFSTVSEFFGQLIQYENDEVLRIRQICNIITNKNILSDAEAVARVWRTLLIDECLDLTYSRAVQQATDIKLNSQFIYFGERQRQYQNCFETGLFHSTTSKNQPFGSSVPPEYYQQFCMDIFGRRFNEKFTVKNVERFNTVYGGLNPNVSQVVFTHGELDPWRTVGVQGRLNQNSQTFVIKGASQSKDLQGISEFDSEELLRVKLEIINLLGQWIK